MTTHPTAAEGSSEQSVSDWSVLSEDLLRGLVHAMNNRITALSAFGELAAMDEDDLEVDVLRQEITRMNAVCALVGMLATRGSVESLEVRPVLDAAIQLHAHHPRTRSVPCEVEQEGTMLPVRVPRWALLRALLLVIDVAKRQEDAARVGVVRIRLSGDETTVRVHLPIRGPVRPDARRMAELCGGRIDTSNDELVLELLTLPELRRRERAG